MDIQTTKIELIRQILNVQQESVLNKLKAVLASEENDIVAFTASGEALTKDKYIAKIKQISNEINEGAKTYTSNEIKDFVLNRDKHKK